MSIFKSKPTTLVLLFLFSFLLFLVPKAGAAPPADTCALPVPLEDLSALVGDSGIKGYTVVQGDTVEEFDVEVLGVQDNAWYPGGKIVIARASGAPIDAAGGGVAAGMSGSPIYTSTGQLIGALAYGFSSSPNPIIGITPAALMAEDLPSASSAKAIELSEKTRAAAKSEGFSVKTLHPLRPVLSVTGSLQGSVGQRFQEEMRERGFQVMPGRGAAKASPESMTRGSVLPDPSKTLLPGETMVADLSYGRTAAGGLGTVTWVCDGQFLGFGHPYLNDIATRAVVSRGEIFTMIVDETWGPYKYGVATEPVGTMTLDNMFAVGGNLGQATETIDVNGGVVDMTSGRAFAGMMTQIAQTPDPAVSDYEWWFTPYLATIALSNEIAALTKRGPYAFGSVTGGWKIEGTSKEGPFSFIRSDAWTGYESGDGLFSYGAAGDALYMDLDDILGYSMNNPSEEIEIDSIEPALELRSKLSYYRPVSLSWKKGAMKNWSTKKKIQGLGKSQTVKLRLRFKRISDGKNVDRFLTMEATKNRGSIVIMNQGPGEGQANSFSDLLKKMGQESNTRLMVEAKGLRYKKGTTQGQLVFDRALSETYFDLSFSK